MPGNRPSKIEHDLQVNSKAVQRTQKDVQSYTQELVGLKKVLADKTDEYEKKYQQQ